MNSRAARILAAIAPAVWLALPAGADTIRPTPEKGAATLTVTYEIRGGGKDLPASRERHVIWTIKDRYTLTATMTAQSPAGFGAMHKPDAAEQKREADRAKAANDAATTMQPMMAQAEQIMKVCGEDQACIQREVMKMAQGMNPNAPELQGARRNMEKASVMPAVRYQMFGPATQSATFAVDEVAREAYFDAACSLATEVRCAFDTTVRGDGDITDQAGSKQTRTGAMAEIDFQSGTLMLKLPVPGFAKATKTVASQNRDIKTGTSEVLRGVKPGDIGDAPIKAICGACETATGSFEREVVDELLRRPAKLVVTWRFKRS